MLIVDAVQTDHPIVFMNAAFSALSGYSEAEVLGRNCRFLQGVDTDPLVVAELSAAVKSGARIRREILNYRKDGSTFWNDLTIDPIVDTDGRLIGFVGLQSHADAIHIVKEEKAEAEARLDSIANNVPGYIYRRLMRTDGSIEIDYCSPSLGKMLGVPEVEILRSFYDYVHRDDRDAVIDAVRASAANMSIFREEFRLVSASGGIHWLRSDAAPRRMKNGDVVWDGLAIEISAEKQWQSEIANLVANDPLTGLRNREAWREALAARLDTSRAGHHPCGLLYVDIEAFRSLNDRFGQAICDAILREVAKRLMTVSASVGGVAARLGGDEFAMLIPDCHDADACPASPS